MKQKLFKAREIISETDSISLPKEVLELQNILNTTDFPDPHEIDQIISQNQTLAGEVIALANQPAIQGKNPRPVVTIKDAINIIGTLRLKNLVMSIALKLGMETLGLEDLTSHSVEVAAVSAELANHIDLIDSDEAYLLGLFHNIGALVMAVMDNSYEERFFQTLTAPFSEYRKEEADYGTSHSFIGVVIADQWSLTDTFKKVMILHHQEDLRIIKNEELRVLVALIQLANAIVSEMVFGTYVAKELKDMVSQAEEVLMLKPEVVAEIRVALLTNSLGEH